MPQSVARLFGGLHAAMARATVGEPMVYRLFLGRQPAGTPGLSGEMVDNYLDVPLRNAFQQTWGQRARGMGEVRVSIGNVQQGAITVEFEASALDPFLPQAASQTMSTNDLLDIPARNERYRVTDWARIGGALYRVAVERLNP